MKLKHFFTALIAAAGLFACATTASAAVQVEVTKPQFNVAINGNYVDNDYRQYPFIVYKDVTYFPMTYNDCAFLGLTNSWSPETGTVLSLAPSNGIYDDMITASYNEDISEYDGRHLFYATITEGPIWVNNTYVNNSTQQYPILTFRDVPYFPLTWDWCQAFGWASSFTMNGGLSVCSPEYASALGYVNYYTYEGDVFCCTMPMIDMIKDGEYSFSPNFYTFTRDGADSLDAVYTLTEHGGYECLFCYPDKVDYMASGGWYAPDRFYELFQSKAKSMSLKNLIFSFSWIEENGDYSASYEAADILSDLKNNYISVWSYDQSKVMCVPKSEVQAYRNAAWFTYDDLAVQKIKSLAEQWKFADAVLLCNTVRDRWMFNVNNYNTYGLPSVYESELDSSYYSTYSNLARTYADTNNAYSGPMVAVFDNPENNKYYGFTYYPANKIHATVDIYDEKFNFTFTNMGYSDITWLDLVCELYDGSGYQFKNNQGGSTHNFYFSAYEGNNSRIKPADSMNITWNNPQWADVIILKSLTATFANGQQVTYYY